MHSGGACCQERDPGAGSGCPVACESPWPALWVPPWTQKAAQGRPAPCSPPASFPLRSPSSPLLPLAEFPRQDVSRGGGEGTSSRWARPTPLDPKQAANPRGTCQGPGPQAWVLGCDFVPQSWALQEAGQLSEVSAKLASKLVVLWLLGMSPVQTKGLPPKRWGISC